ncbi:MAG: HAD family hydrolase [Steroidobacterales bacterium]
MSKPSPVRAVLFDLDGTLVDSEMYTDQAVSLVVEQFGLRNFVLPTSETRGRTWAYVAHAIRARTKITASVEELAAGMLAFWTKAAANVNPVPGAPQAVRAAADRQLKLGVVSSSPRFLIDSFIEKLGVGDCIPAGARIGGDMVRNTKPDPEGYLLAARSLDVDPGETLVFEDSRAGLLAAQGAGMRSIFITCCATDIAENTRLATAVCTDFLKLPPRFWDDLVSGAVDLDGRSFT